MTVDEKNKVMVIEVGLARKRNRGRREWRREGGSSEGHRSRGQEAGRARTQRAERSQGTRGLNVVEQNESRNIEQSDSDRKG